MIGIIVIRVYYALVHLIRVSSCQYDKFCFRNQACSTKTWIRTVQHTVETAFYDHPLMQQNILKQQVVCETRVAKTCSCKVNTFLLLQFEGEGIFRTVTTHLQLYTLISYIFAVQSLHKRWFQAYTSLQGTCVLYCGPILR